MINENKSTGQLDLLSQLRIINDVKFTHRELDIISFFVCGRSAKKIASFFSISPKTVENHVHNIMVKLGCNSREHIIDFIEKSNKLAMLRQYYNSLLVKVAFEKALQEIGKITRGQNYACILAQSKTLENQSEVLSQLERSLRLAGVETSLVLEDFRESSAFFQKDKPIVYLSSNGKLSFALETESPLPSPNADTLFLFLPQVQAPISLLCEREGENSERVKNTNSYYRTVFEILNNILPFSAINVIRQEFLQQQDTIQNTTEQDAGLSLKEESPHNKIFFSQVLPFLQGRKVWTAIIVVGVLNILFVGIHKKDEKGLTVHSLQQSQKNLEREKVRSDLVLPSNILLLDRPELLAKIHEKFRGNASIQTVALVGVGGAGKTTLARRYASSQKVSCIWEINAESQKTLTDSFEGLAQTLSHTEEDSKILASILKLRDSAQRKAKIISFVRERLKSYPHWFLLYDNVETFADIQDFFPKDTVMWGEGRVILTSRDSNIENNNYVNNIITVGELTSADKRALFTKIMNNGDSQAAGRMPLKEVNQFLAEIPPFPLDILIAAYYIKATNTSYQQYLKKSRTYNYEFSKTQEKLLREAGEYAQTRYNMITLSLKHLVDLNPDHKDLLLLVSLLNPTAIQKELLLNFRNEDIVDNFIVHMKRYSLVGYTKTGLYSSKPTFSIHRSTQQVILSYLIHRLNLKKNDASVKRVAKVLEHSMNAAVSTEDFATMKILSDHAEHLLASQLLSGQSAGELSGELGCIYYYLCNYSQAKSLLNFAITQLKKAPNYDASKVAYCLLYLGNVHRRLGEYGPARELLEQSIKLYSCSPRSHLGRARASGYLGMIYESLGLFDKARILLRESIVLHEAHAPHQIGHAWSLAHLGSVYKSIGSYTKARDIYEQSLRIYRKFSPDYVGTAWVCKDLGSIYAILGNYKQAASRLKESLTIYRKHFPEDHIYVAYVFVRLGVLHREVQEFEKAKVWIRKGLKIIQKTYGTDHVEVGIILKELAKMHLIEGDLTKAEHIINHAYAIFTKAKHPEQCETLEILGDICQKKSRLVLQKEGMTTKAKQLQIQAQQHFIKAVKVVETYFPKDSSHYIRIHNKAKMNISL